LSTNKHKERPRLKAIATSAVVLHTKFRFPKTVSIHGQLLIKKEISYSKHL